jgi:quinol monooxygenase YgiN
MFVRIVKLTILPEHIEDFGNLFQEYKLQIRAREGCTYLEMLQDRNDPGVFFTYSKWEDEKFLDAYRDSELFDQIWTKTKTYFAGKPEAWSVNPIQIIS